MAKRDSDQSADADASGAGEQAEQLSGRPWTMAAAMEPLPPLAPPVEEPLPADARITIGAGRRKARRGSRLWVVLFVLILIAVCVLLFLHSH